jgi:hypothetical protein
MGVLPQNQVSGLSAIQTEVDSNKTVDTIRGYNESVILDGDPYNRLIYGMYVSCETPAVSQISIDPKINGVSILTTPALITVGKKFSENVSINTSADDWDAFTDITVSLPDTSGNNITIRIYSSHNGVEQSYPLPKLTAPTASTLQVLSSTSLRFTWTDPNTSPQETSITYEHDTDSNFGTATQVTGLAAGTVTGDITGLTTDVPIYARVKAVGDGIANEDSLWSSSLNATPTSTTVTKQGTNVGEFFSAVDPDSTTKSHILVTGSDRIVIGWIVAEGTVLNTPTMTATYGGQSMTFAGFANRASSWVGGFYIAEANLPSDGSNDFVVSHSGFVGDDVYLYVAQLGGCQFDTFYFENADDYYQQLSNTVNPTYNGSYIMSGFMHGSSSSSPISENAGQVQLVEGNFGSLGVSISELENQPTGLNTLTSSSASAANHLARCAMVIAPKQV